MTTTTLILSVLLAFSVTLALALAFYARTAARRGQEAIREAIESLKVQFAATASKELSEQTGSLIDGNRKEVSAIAGNLLGEMRAAMKELREATDSAAKENSAIGAKILSGVQVVRDSAATLGLKTEGLEQALAGGGKRQGIWGEAVLAKVLGYSGLEKGVNYTLQEGAADAGIPDSMVTDPAGRILIIDSKTSLTAYLKACNAADDAETERHLDEHVKSVKAHIDELAAKNYAEKFQKSDPGHTYIRQVAMFVPSEAAHAAALARDPTLMQYAAEKGIALVTPSTLQAYLHIVALAWQQDSADRNHEMIIEKARLMLDRTATFMEALDNMGVALDKARQQYETVMKTMGRIEGRQSLLKPAQELIALGVKLDRNRHRAFAIPPSA